MMDADMKYVVAVSGGVDSVVLLDMLAKQGEHELVVAHFDHGIRPGSADDAAFVAALSRVYGLTFETRRVELGPTASEEQARVARYVFLNEVATKHGGVIATAHHMDDIVETIAINLVRGTGWRGLAVLNDPNIRRPLLGLRKSELYEYALKNGLEWVEDETNGSDAYLRNRLRAKMNQLPSSTYGQLVDLWRRQRILASDIDREAERLATGSRYFMTMVDEPCAQEVLRRMLADLSLSLTRPQRSRVLHAIRTARPGSTLQAGSGVSVTFTTRDFIVKHP
jgi:tRNA(Ile)-lysidine synthetase-like protein